MTAHERLARQIADWFGLDLARGGRLDALEGVIGQRARSVRASSPDAYVASLRGPDDPEVALLVETITVGHTWFFRDEEQTRAIASALEELAATGSRPEVWVAGCSTGEDAYTVALLAHAASLDVDVLGTDISTRAVERARAARYGAWATRRVPPAHTRHFADAQGTLVLDSSVANKVRFERHNLLGPVPASHRGGAWDIILCRNVLIYFLRTAAVRVVERLAASLRPGGWLFLGASEVIEKPPKGCSLRSIGTRLAVRRLSDPDPVEPSSPQRAFPPSVTSSEENLIERALERLEAGRNDEAIMICARILETDPLRAEAHLVSGMAFQLGRDPESAIRALSSAVLLDEDLWPAFFYLGQALEKLGRDAEASVAYREADARAHAGHSRSLGTLDAYKSEIAALARERVQRLGA